MLNRFTPRTLYFILLIAAPVWAHHSAANYDFQNQGSVSGVIVEVSVANPHLHLVLEVSDGAGTRRITYEGHSRNNLYRRGWRPGMLNPGESIRVNFATPRDGSEGGYVTSVITAAGVEF